MKFLEYQAKEVFRQFGISTPVEKLANNLEEALQQAKQIGYPCVLKAQVPVGGRGKAGGIKLANNEAELKEHYSKIYGMNIKECIVSKILISQVIQVTNEIYLSVTLDRNSRKPMFILSASGGMDIEEISRTQPDKILRFDYDLLVGLKDYSLKSIYKKLIQDLSLTKAPSYDAFKTLLKQLVRIYFDLDASLVEINPLTIQGEEFMALDAKLVVDDNAGYLHQDLVKITEGNNVETKQETMAREANLTYISLQGNIACIVNGAGLAMATMDVIKHYGGEPANFLDIGGSSNPQKMVNALQIIYSNEKTKAILINIFGGITRCDDIANGLKIALETIKLQIPISVRLVGTNEEEAKKVLSSIGITAFSDMDQAVQHAIQLTLGGN
ncbi:MAG: ADP-forming succinate--CoA ligase subunit beta [Caldisericia bacterium]|nr:ADP-forming succinate--CoA ligase subunit beta [Caldisericia bacterium]